MESTLKRTWAEISLDNLTHNFETIRRQVGPKAKLLGVVKADAYGHGAVRVAQRLQRAGCQWVAINCYDEAEELRAAWDCVDGNFRETLRQAADNIRHFHEAQVHRDFCLTDRPGVVLGQRYTPVERVGICVPGSPVAFPSTILMNVIPARIAGVKEIAVVTPPNQNGAISAEALAAAKIAGADRVFKIGGAQAVAALAYGTESVPRVDKIVGPGGI